MNNIILVIDYLIWGLLIYIKKLKALMTHLARIDELAIFFFQNLGWYILAGILHGGLMYLLFDFPFRFLKAKYHQK